LVSRNDADEKKKKKKQKEEKKKKTPKTKKQKKKNTQKNAVIENQPVNEKVRRFQKREGNKPYSTFSLSYQRKKGEDREGCNGKKCNQALMFRVAKIHRY